ncbi:MAG TPA: hypothetical protein VF509_15955 [Sphingobium sp.]
MKLITRAILLGDRMLAWDISILGLMSVAQHEIMLFAAVGVAIGGMDDLAIDLIFFARQTWRR